MSETDSGNYGASALSVLKGLDAVRKRPGMYIGGLSERGLLKCAEEILDNSIDEAIAGHCTVIQVVLHADESIEVVDNGRGIPVDLHPIEGISGVEMVFTELHAGGKFGGGGYEVSGGLHGVGASVVNALSRRVDVEVKRGGEVHSLSFSRGVAGEFSADGLSFTPGVGLRVTGKCPKTETGTRVRYWIDRKIFPATVLLPTEDFITRIRQSAFLVPGLRIEFTDARADEITEEVFHYTGGMKDLVEFLSASPAVSDVFHLTGESTFKETVPMMDEDGNMVSTEVERRMQVEVALRWGTDYETTIRSFVNIVETGKGGTHTVGFERALLRAVNEQLKTFKILKGTEKDVLKEDIMEGLTAVVLVRVPEPQFEGQTKEILGTTAATKIVLDVVGNALKEQFVNPKRKAEVRNVLEKINQAAKTRMAAKLHKETIRRKNSLESSSLPAKLSDCRSKDMEKTELFIIEGDSAGGTVKQARDSEFQALMPIRGKILNTQKATEKQMLENAECSALITAMGAGSGRSFDIESIRYGKLIILADADVDGSHIRCLLLTLCWRYMRPLLMAGRVYAAVPPLYRITEKGSVKTPKHHYAFSDTERDEIIARLEKGPGVKDGIQRYKGLGEMDADQLAETTINMDNRTLRRIRVDEAEEASAIFELLMGEAPGPRKIFITENGGLLDPTRIDA